MRSALLHPHSPEREGRVELKGLRLTFHEIPQHLYPLYWWGRERLEEDPRKVQTLFIANEIGVEGFLKGKISFPQLPGKVVELAEVLEERLGAPPSDFSELEEYFKEAKREWGF